MGDHDRRQAYEVGGESGVPVGPGRASSFDSRTIDFGHYAGRTIADLAEEDPDYLHWLARHPSGVRYRAEIARVLASVLPHPGDWQR
jgi:uncharacterized protein (DUF3820 family)